MGGRWFGDRDGFGEGDGLGKGEEGRGMEGGGGAGREGNTKSGYVYVSAHRYTDRHTKVKTVAYIRQSHSVHLADIIKLHYLHYCKLGISIDVPALHVVPLKM